MSKFRNVFCKGIWRYTHNWTNIMQILKDYKATIPLTGTILGWLAGDYLELSTSIQAAKDAGFSEYWFVLELFADPGTHSDWKSTKSDETTCNWVCPNKSAVRTTINNFLGTLINGYDITGIVWDYIRYPTDTELGGKAICYCSECKAYLEAYLKEEIETWPGDFAPGGSRYDEFKTWRYTELTNLVSDLRDTVLGLDGGITISAAVYPCPWWTSADYYKMESGVDKKVWVSSGLIDIVSPMIYEEVWGGVDGFLNKITVDYNYMECDPSEYAPWICTGSPETGWEMDLDVFKAEVLKCEEYAGSQIWRYNDEPDWNPPDDGSGENDPPHDIRPYLNYLIAPSSGYPKTHIFSRPLTAPAGLLSNRAISDMWARRKGV